MSKVVHENRIRENKINTPKFYVSEMLSQINLIIKICLFKDLQFRTSI